MKKIIAILILAMVLAVSARAQIFLEDGSTSNRTSPSSEDIGVIPYHGVENDQAGYVPTGSGIALLAALGGAYLLNRKKKTK